MLNIIKTYLETAEKDHKCPKDNDKIHTAYRFGFRDGEGNEYDGKRSMCGHCVASDKEEAIEKGDVTLVPKELQQPLEVFSQPRSEETELQGVEDHEEQIRSKGKEIASYLDREALGGYRFDVAMRVTTLDFKRRGYGKFERHSPFGTEGRNKKQLYVFPMFGEVVNGGTSNFFAAMIVPGKGKVTSETPMDFASRITYNDEGHDLVSLDNKITFGEFYFLTALGIEEYMGSHRKH